MDFRRPTLTDFLMGLRAYFEHQFSMGFTTAQVFDILEKTYRRADQALAARQTQPMKAPAATEKAKPPAAGDTCPAAEALVLSTTRSALASCFGAAQSHNR